jgi:isoaspartyl peptidase/L-asparaginase-like protein (Ntn-hydrolase superfamily)
MIIVHGGAGFWPLKLHRRALRCVRKAATVGSRVLFENGSAVDAVEAAVIELENDPIIQCGDRFSPQFVGRSRKRRCHKWTVRAYEEAELLS